MKEDFATAVRNRNAPRICQLLLGNENEPRLGRGRGIENELWDFKEDVPSDPRGWAKLARHVLAFHNNRGGAIIFGIRDNFSFCGVRTRIDSKIFNDKIRRYVGDRIWVDFHREWIQEDQRYLGVAIVPPRGPIMSYFQADAPLSGEKRDFRRGDSAMRTGDSSVVLRHEDAAAYQANVSSAAIVGEAYAIDIPYFRILPLETHQFISRFELEKQVSMALKDPRTSVASLVGIGGSGKTTLATWAVLAAYESKKFDAIVSLTAKDRELAVVGIQSIGERATSFDLLLDTILDVLGFGGELDNLALADREREVRALLEGSNTLLYVDNLETVDDPRVVAFLDDLPVGVRAIVTSRRAAVRVAVRPVDVGPLSLKEARALVLSMKTEPGTGYVADLSEPEIDRIADACDRLPLAIRWTLMRAGSAAEAVHRADTLRSSSDRDEGQLLEFVFRRVFEDMTEAEKAVMRTLSIFSEGSPTETLVAGTGHDPHVVQDALDDLARDALAQRMFDPARNDYTFTLAPLTRSFVLNELRRDRRSEELIRHRLTNWYEASDVRNPKDRAVIREMRQGIASSEEGLIDLGYDAEKRGDLRSAQDMYEQALTRNPKSWRAARRLAEFERHYNQNRVRALELYERAGANAPAHGDDRALIFREWGMLLRDSGKRDAIGEAIEKFETARKETPNDPTLLHALASLYDGRGVYRKVIELLEPLKDHPSPKTRAMFLRLLVRAYDQTSAIIEAAEARRDLTETESKLR